MTSLSVGEEQALVQDSIRGIETAMDELDLAINELFGDPEPYGNVRLNKLVHMALVWGYDEPDQIPIQHSWHRYGADYGNAIPQISELQPTAIDDLPSPDQPSISSHHSNRYPSKEEYHHFFVSDINIERIAGLSIHDFLEEFYEEYAPSQYRSLYLANVSLQRVLYNHSNSITIDEFDEESYQNISHIITLLHRELAACSDSAVQEAAPRVVEFTDLVEDVYMMLSRLSAEEIVSSPELVIREINRIYHDTAWKYVSEVISKSTAQGTNSSELVTAASSEIEMLESAHNGVPNRLNTLVADAGLFPTSDDFNISPDSNLESGEQIVKLTDTYAK